jgi:hypothetical protein
MYLPCSSDSNCAELLNISLSDFSRGFQYLHTASPSNVNYTFVLPNELWVAKSFAAYQQQQQPSLLVPSKLG